MPHSLLPWVTATAALAALAAAPARAELALPERRSTAAHIEFVKTPDWRALTGRAFQGVLIVDLDGLDDEDAAVTLADHWRARLGATVPVQCWLRTGLQAPGPRRLLLSQAASRLAASSCQRVLVPA